LGTDQFVISKNEVSTNLVAQDGETIVIGGLVNETDSNSRDAIPLLGNIPILGYLFGRTADQKQRQELIILLTPRVVRNQSEADKMTSDYYKMFKNVSKELDIEKHKKSTSSQKQSSEKTAPAAKEKADEKASPSAVQKNSSNNGQSEYPLRSDD
jgi:type II secretory pathway component GspD/PulD (secretin)